jgi:ANTAR domain
VSISSRSSRDLQVRAPAFAPGLADETEGVGEAGGAGQGAVTVSTMTDAVLTRHLASQALGIVMERFALNPTRAFEYLVRTAQASERTLGLVAAELVASANERGDSGTHG